MSLETNDNSLSLNARKAAKMLQRMGKAAVERHNLECELIDLIVELGQTAKPLDLQAITEREIALSIVVSGLVTLRREVEKHEQVNAIDAMIEQIAKARALLKHIGERLS